MSKTHRSYTATHHQNLLHRQHSDSISKRKFPGFSRLRLALFPDPSEIQVLVLRNFNRLLLPYTDFFPSSFCFNMQWMCIYTLICSNQTCALKHCYDNKQQSRNSDDTHHFSLTTNKIPRLSRTFQVNGNPDRVKSRTFTSAVAPSWSAASMYAFHSSSWRTTSNQPCYISTNIYSSPTENQRSIQYPPKKFSHASSSAALASNWLQDQL